MFWAIVAIVCFAIWLFIVLNDRVTIYRNAKQKQLEEDAIREALNGFNIDIEKGKILKVLRDTLPQGYRCGRSGCDGILLKQSDQDMYFCSNCHSARQRINIKG